MAVSDADWKRCREIYRLRNAQLIPYSLEAELKNAANEIPEGISPQEKEKVIRTITEEIIKKHSSSSIEDRRYALQGTVTNDQTLIRAFKQYIDERHMEHLRKCFDAEQIHFEGEQWPISEEKYNMLPPMLQGMYTQREDRMYVRTDMGKVHVGGGRFRTRRRRKVSCRSKSKRNRRCRSRRV